MLKCDIGETVRCWEVPQWWTCGWCWWVGGGIQCRFKFQTNEAENGNSSVQLPMPSIIV